MFCTGSLRLRPHPVKTILIRVGATFEVVMMLLTTLNVY